MKYHNEKTKGLSLIFDDEKHTLEINLSASEKADVAVTITCEKQRVYFATGWTIEEGMNAHTFENVFVFGAGKFSIHIYNTDNDKKILKSVLYISDPTKG